MLTNNCIDVVWETENGREAEIEIERERMGGGLRMNPICMSESLTIQLVSYSQAHAMNEDPGNTYLK